MCDTLKYQLLILQKRYKMQCNTQREYIDSYSKSPLKMEIGVEFHSWFQ